MTLIVTPPIHPGEFLREEFLEPFGLKAEALASGLHVETRTVEGLIREESALSADLALRLARFFGTSPEFWLNVQQSYDLSREIERLGSELEMISRYQPAA